MNKALITANLNLYAVLKNLELLVQRDREISDKIKQWDISVQFSVRNGPKAYVKFKDGICTVGRGKCKRPSIKLFFLSPAHLNKMFEGTGTPIPLKGFTKIGFLTGDFTKLTEKLEYYLKPEEGVTPSGDYKKINTELTLLTGAYALKELTEYDPIGIATASHMRDGTIVLKVMPDGPAVSINVEDGILSPSYGEDKKPMARLELKNIDIANKFLNGEIDSFTAIASGDVRVMGQISMLDAMSLVLDRIPEYIS